MAETLYDILGVHRDATAADLTAARDLLRQGGFREDEHARMVEFAYDVLSNSERRHDYDSKILPAQANAAPVESVEPPANHAPAVKVAPEWRLDRTDAAAETTPRPSSPWSTIPLSRQPAAAEPQLTGPAQPAWAPIPLHRPVAAEPAAPQMPEPPTRTQRLFPAGWANRGYVLAGAATVILGSSVFVATLPAPDDTTLVVLAAIIGIIGAAQRRLKLWAALAQLAPVAGAVLSLVGVIDVVSPSAAAATIAAVAGWFLAGAGIRSWRALSTDRGLVHRWELLKASAAAAENGGPFLVTAIDGTSALVQSTDGREFSIDTWGRAQRNTWVVLNSEAVIVATAPGRSSTAWVNNRRREENAGTRKRRDSAEDTPAR
ncbi:hypothetical protein [Leifsonia sp. Leaf264]|uniref:hypothetical protein n=1 Tax=Leifsonia sp. Leaf264 TaxID=1736314 RepID=UPI0006F48DA4|nr:hypothetical protein [Leifsonia sp. Leaf264]KQO98301.1 hypothetical protein ASF30_09585 [Leifsonia sp. Leaf264]